MKSRKKPTPFRWSGKNFLATTSKHERKVISVRFSRLALIPVAIAVAMLFNTGAASANTIVLSQVGPELTSSNVKSETQEMLRHDQGIQEFLGLNSRSAQGITVTKAERFTCEVGVNSECPINTGVNGTKLEETRYRFGTFVEAYRVTFLYEGKQYKVTFEQKCSNLLSGKKLMKKVKKLVVSKTKPIKIHLVLNVSASATCNGATSSASLNIVPITVHNWKEIYQAILSGSPNVSASCTSPPPPPAPPTPEQPKIEVKEPICSTVIAGSGNTGDEQKVECKCNGFDACNKENHEEPKVEPTCEPPTTGEYPNCKVPPTIEWPHIQEFEPEERSKRCIKVHGEDVTLVELEGTYGYFENNDIAVNKEGTDEWCQWFVAPSPGEVPPGGFEILKAYAQEENNPALSETSEDKVEIIPAKSFPY